MSIVHRSNENLGLALIHTLFLREHNRIADQLSDLNRHWNDEMLFQEARRIVGAQLQHIAYNEFLPHVLGEETIDNFGLRLQTDGYYDGYDLGINPIVENAVANAVFAFLYTTMPDTMERYSKELNMMGAMKLNDMLFDTSQVFSNKLDEYMMGMVSQNGRQADAFVIDEVTNSLGEKEREAFDFVAFTIQQGRDHGLPGYVEFRRACRLDEENKIESFEDLINVMKPDVLKRLMSLYANVYDVDLFTGGLAERTMAGALVGPTFSCLLARQFDNLRRGDRFWYENDLPPSAFSKEQLAEIRKSTLARILCDNGDKMDFVQPEVMLTSDVFLNAFQYCNTDIIERIDLSKWKTSPRDFTSNLTISDEILETEFASARRAANDRFERDRLIGSGSSNKLSHSQLLHYKTTQAKIATLKISNASLVFEKATYGLLRHLRHGRDRETTNDLFNDVSQLVSSLSRLDLADYVKNEALMQSAIIDEQCHEQSLPCDHTTPYRTISGWCNNLAHPDYGQSMTMFERFLPPAYDDGISRPRWRSKRTGRPLPSARLVSSNVHDDVSSPHLRYSLAMMQYGQFLDHDMTFTPQYLTSGGQLLNCKTCDSAETIHPECWPIEIPPNDVYFSQSGTKQCLHFVRSINAQRTLGRREQMNQLTSYIDASNVYGSDICEAKKLRAFQRGRLNSTRHPVAGFKDLLPQTATHIECKAPSGYCFLAGDLRASEQPSLACMHTIWMRQHNRVAEELSKLNPNWNDERLYQMTRKIIGAMVQHVTFNEFLPRLLGMNNIDHFGLKLEVNGYYDGYDPTCSSMLRNEFSAAVYRLGHTLLKPSFERLDANYKTARKPLKLREAFFNSDMLYQRK